MYKTDNGWIVEQKQNKTYSPLFHGSEHKNDNQGI